MEEDCGSPHLLNVIIRLRKFGTFVKEMVMYYKPEAVCKNFVVSRVVFSCKNIGTVSRTFKLFSGKTFLKCSVLTVPN